MEEKEDAMFERIMTKIGSRGKFQKRYNYVFNMFFIMLATMPFFNFVMVMAVPDHWCHVPGRNGTNYTLDQWKEITLPSCWAQLGSSWTGHGWLEDDRGAVAGLSLVVRGLATVGSRMIAAQLLGSAW
uniref:Uncharacterized protein n=1 Tax=Timema bartmani TaxID=61472 RepID=A0A7R9F7H2_9NEOP|nr:unnamed protein product [Timema bartmani]